MVFSNQVWNTSLLVCASTVLENLCNLGVYRSMFKWLGKEEHCM